MFNHWIVRPGTYNSKVTVELRELVDSGVDIWAFEHKPVYTNEADQKAFEQKFIDRFRFRQIGQETVGRFLHYFRTKYNELVPFYLDMYESVRLMHSVEDPFKAYDLTETYTQTTTNKGNSTTEGDSFATQSDTPQNYTRGSSSNHVSAVSEGDSKTTTVDDSNGTMNYTLKREGNIGVQPLGQEIEAYRKALINVDEQFFDEFNNLFLLTY